jgi:chromosomal replication initiator protein
MSRNRFLDSLSTIVIVETGADMGQQAFARRVIAQISQAFGVSLGDLTGPKRHQRIYLARMAAAKAMRETGMTFAAIGKALGGRDHTTIMAMLQDRRVSK